MGKIKKNESGTRELSGTDKDFLKKKRERLKKR